MLGKLLKNRRAGETDLAWNAPNLTGPAELAVASPHFEHGAAIPAVHAGRSCGGEDVSPALTWGAAPAGTAQLLLVVEDPDAPTPKPFVHGVFLVEPELTGVERAALNGDAPAAGVRALRSDKGHGYLGPAPLKGHGPHRYVFQLFALERPLTSAKGGADLGSAKPRAVLAAAGGVLARGRLDGVFERS